MADSKGSNLLFYLIIVFIGIAFSWVYVAEIDEVIRAPGVIEPEGQVQKVQSRTSGKIATIAAKLGDKVSKDQVLILLDDEEARASVEKNTITLDSLAAEILRLEAEVEMSGTIAWQSNISSNAKDVQTRLFSSRMASLRQQQKVLAEEVDQLKNSLIETRQLIEGQKAMLSLKQDERKIYKPLVDQGAEPAVRLVAIDQEIQEINNNISSNKIRLDGINIKIKTLIEREKEIITNHKSNAFDALAPKKVEFQITKAETIALKKRLSDNALKSPIDGIITKVYPAGEGEIVNAGSDLVEIIPISNNISVLAKLPTKDISSIKVGQTTRIALDAYDFTVYGTIPSYIDKIAQNTTKLDNGEAYYEVWLKTRDLKFSKSSELPEIVPGMLAQIEITGDKRTVLEYLMKPVLETAAKAMTEK